MIGITRDDCGWAEGARETRRDAEKTRHEKDNTNRSKIEKKIEAGPHWLDDRA